MADEPLLENNELEFISDIYHRISKLYHRGDDGIYESDLWFEMFCVDEQYWWMNVNHPYVAMIVENDYGSYPITLLINNMVVVYTADVMRECISTIKNMCLRNDFIIKEDE